MTAGGAREGYRGYRVVSTWVSDHWVHKVYWNGHQVDSFLDLEDARTTIDSWLDAR